MKMNSTISRIVRRRDKSHFKWAPSLGSVVACIKLKRAQSNPVLSFGRFHESGGFPKGWPFGRARRRETPQQPDLINRIGLKARTKDSRQEFLIKKPLRIVSWGSLDCALQGLIGMNPIQGFSSASSGPQAGLPHNQSR